MFLVKDKNFYTSIKYYFTHAALQYLERELLKRLELFLEMKIETICVKPGTVVLGDDKCLVLMDEADDIIIDQLKDINAKHVVGLTATATKGFENIESSYVRKLGFAIVESKIDSALYTKYDTVNSVAEFLNVSVSQPKLIFGNDATEAELKRLNVQFKVDVVASSVLKRLSKTDILLVKNPQLMRGFDYSTSVPAGISMLIAARLSGKRTLRQAWGRCGRNGQQSSRYMLKSLGSGIDMTRIDLLNAAILSKERRVMAGLKAAKSYKAG